MKFLNKKMKAEKISPSTGFNTALLLNVEKSNYPPSISPPSLSPRSNNQCETDSTLHNYLPFDLIDRIETISPVQKDRTSNSRKMSDLEMNMGDDKSHSSFNEENDEIFLNQYEDIKYVDEFGKNTQSTNSLSTNHKSSTGSNNSNNSANMIDRMKMNFMNNFNQNVNNARKYSVPGWLPQSFLQQSMNQQNVMKPKKKGKKKKKKEKDEYTIEMFGRRGWICEQCNNFNYDSRHKCNRCGIPKQAKLINSALTSIVSDQNMEVDQSSSHKGDWCCQNCNNLNYAFRLVCNRCQMPKSDGSKIAYSSS